MLNWLWCGVVCVWCSLYCEPASLAVSCSSMQCTNSNLMLGNITVQQSSAGCNVTTCDYNGFANGTILTMLTRSLQPRCPGPQQFAPLLAPPDTVPKDLMYAPAPSPDYDGPGSIAASPGSSVIPPGGGSLPGNPANGPAGSISTAPTVYSFSYFFIMFLISISFVFSCWLSDNNLFIVPRIKTHLWETSWWVKPKNYLLSWSCISQKVLISSRPVVLNWTKFA